ncbi:MAG: hypothetical protein ABEJ85_01150 [Haloarculaceae archaeon]
MDFSNVRTHLEQECHFPVDHETLVEEIGGITIEAPRAEPETVETVLNRTEETTYQSVDDVYATLVGTVDDAYIGRKFYDDRGGAPSIPEYRPRRTGG